MKKTFLLLCFLITVFGQFGYAQKAGTDQYKREALSHIQNGRFGEAIDLLNKYIVANPRIPDGYNLIGLCFEKRGQYEDAVINLRRALKLAPNNSEIQKNYNRIINAWYPLLNRKIEGHKREIAVNPNIAVNYLEIGKCNKYLGKWEDAETWYDEYLKKEDASSDEIIRYSEILAHNNHIQKGEKILKIYTERFPRDQRLWSRYGYFTLWLGKNKIAITAFENALALKPFFKEAQDGLDDAKGRPYNFEWTDTTSRNKKELKPQEYTIDKYYRVLKSNPEDDNMRFLLVDELIKAERVEEAYQQLQILGQKHTGEEKFQQIFDSLTTYRNNLNKKKIEEYSALVQKDPNDKEAVLKLADYYSNLSDYESALNLLGKYLQNAPENGALDVRYKLALISAWNRDFEKSIDQLNILLKAEPDNQKYQLLRAHVGVWTGQDLDMAEKYLKGILEKQPDNIDVIISLGSIYIKNHDMTTAKEYLDKAVAIDPNHKKIKDLQTYYDFTLVAIEENRIYQILEDGRRLALNGDYEGGLVKYEEYFSKAPSPTRLVLAEYADVNLGAKNYAKAIEVTDNLLKEQYDVDVAVIHAKSMLAGGDSLQALEEIRKINKEVPNNFGYQILLSDACVIVHQYSEARDSLESMLAVTQDTANIALINQRINWLPVSNYLGFLSSFPNYIGFNPQFAYYWDNLGFQYKNYTGRLDLGVNNFLTLGASYSQGSLTGNSESINIFKAFTIFKGHVDIRLTDQLSVYTGFGNLTYQGLHNRQIMDAGFRFQKEDVFSLIGNYENTDAGLILYSPYLVALLDRSDSIPLFRFKVDNLRITGYYISTLGLKLAGHFVYMVISDGNKSNDFLIRLQRLFYPELYAGYEYNYINFAFTKVLGQSTNAYYYSPKNFESHSIYADWNLNKGKEFNLFIGGKLGYIPRVDAVLREISGEVTYKPAGYFSLSAKISASGTVRNESSYNSLSAYISAYMSF
ncbi:MAG: tetratricopeptide repeat protein [Ignavibacteria bacterium]